MNNLDGLSNFFFNLLPGAVFLVIIEYLGFLRYIGVIISAPETSRIFYLVIFGLLMGYIFQAISRVIKDHLYEVPVMREVMNSNEPLFNKNLQHLNKINDGRKLLNNSEDRNMIDGFHLMNNYVQAKHNAFITIDFSQRKALWANANIACFFLSFVSYTMLIAYPTIHRFFILIVCVISTFLTYKVARKFLYAYYDAIMKSYFMVYSVGRAKT